MSDTRGHDADRRHLFLLAHLAFEQPQFRHIVEVPYVARIVLLVDHYRRDREPEVHGNPVFPGRYDFKLTRTESADHFRKNLPNRQPRCLIFAIAGDLLRGAIEQVNTAVDVGGYEAGADAIHDPVTECLKK